MLAASPGSGDARPRAGLPSPQSHRINGLPNQDPHLTLRDIALVIAVVLALPGMALILRDARAAYADSARGAERGWHVLWTAVPVAFLIALLAFAVAA